MSYDHIYLNVIKIKGFLYFKTSGNEEDVTKNRGYEKLKWNIWKCL